MLFTMKKHCSSANGQIELSLSDWLDAIQKTVRHSIQETTPDESDGKTVWIVFVISL